MYSVIYLLHMKVCFKGIKENFSDSKIEVIKKFIEYLQSQLPLNKDLHIYFVQKRKRKMTTGVRVSYHQVYILVGGRLLVDILRTISHEWVHEFQHQKLGLKEKQKTQEVGGKVENMANVLSGIFTKKFQKDNPEFDKELYDEE